MKKLFFFLAAFAVAFTANAKVTTISPDAENDALRLAVHYAEDGDIIEMTEGTYVQCNNGYVAFDGKAVTVRAAEGANVVLQPQVRITLANGGKATFENIKIDASHINDLANWYDHVIYVEDATEGKELVMEGCEFYGFALDKAAILVGSEKKLDVCKINNCYFHDNTKSCLFFEGATSIATLSVTNSTFANIVDPAPGVAGYCAGVVDVRSTNAQVTVDHCTFYNCLIENTDYAAVTMKGPKKENVVISNNIFMLPEAIDGHRAIRNDIEATNCMTFNHLKDNGGIHSSVTKTNCQLNVDPKFVDAANGNFALAGDSPALTAGTDGKAIGDPRWAPVVEEPVEPEEPTYDFDVVAKDLYLAADESMTQFEGSNSMNPDAMISVTLWASEYGTYTCAGTDDDQFNAFYMGYQILGELTYSYSEELKSELVVITGTITDEDEATSTIRITMYEEYLEPTDVVVLNNLSKTVQGRGMWASLMLFNAANDTIISLSGCDGTYGKYAAFGTFGALELEGKGEWKNDGENDVFVGVLYNADKTKVFQVTASTPAEAAPEAKEYRFEASDVTYEVDLEGNLIIECESGDEAAEPFYMYIFLAGWNGAGSYEIGEMYGSIATMDNPEGADVANMNSEIEVIVEDGKIIIIGQVEDVDGNIYNLSLEGDVPSVPSGVENNTINVKAVKVIRDGQLIIRNNGVEFNAQGAKL